MMGSIADGMIILNCIRRFGEQDTQFSAEDMMLDVSKIVAVRLVNGRTVVDTLGGYSYEVNESMVEVWDLIRTTNKEEDDGWDVINFDEEE